MLVYEKVVFCAQEFDFDYFRAFFMTLNEEIYKHVCTAYLNKDFYYDFFCGLDRVTHFFNHLFVNYVKFKRTLAFIDQMVTAN